MSPRTALLALLILVACVIPAQATTVNVSIGKETYRAQESVRISLTVDPSKPVGGQLMVYKKDDGRYSIARLLYTKPTPEQCLSCVRDYPLSEYLNRTFLFEPVGDGDYMVEAHFGGVRDAKNFTVGSTSTSTTTTVAPSTTILPVSSSTTSTSSTTSSTSTSSVTESTTTLGRARETTQAGYPRSVTYALVASAGLILAYAAVRLSNFRIP